MNDAMWVLAVNVGSSSLKLAVWEGLSRRLIELEARDIGRARGILAENGAVVARKAVTDHGTALAELLRRLPERERISRIGHRVVHGGARYHNVTWLNDTVLRDLHDLVPLSPLHQPQALAVVRACRKHFPHIPQAAVFDTAFHASLPPHAHTYAIPAAWREAGVRRYGFHGIACADIVAQLDGELRKRAVFLHLGAGCSATAVLQGKSIDTSMGFTPLEGLVMATRSGDLDPGALLYVQREFGMTPTELDHALNEESGLLAVSGASSDMRELLHRQDERAALAIDLFCHRAAKAVGALTVVLGGLGQLIFSGGIGEHAAAVRARIGSLLECLGVVIDVAGNDADTSVISAPDSAVDVRVVKVDEERQIARETMMLNDRNFS